MTKRHSIVLSFMTLALSALLLGACSSDDGGDSDGGSPSTDASDAPSDVANASDSGCSAEQYRHPQTQECQSCPAPEFTCELVQLDQSSIDPSTNVVEIVLAEDAPQITSARGSGMKNTGEGPGGTFSEPMSTQGTVDANVLTFDFSQHADADELQLSAVRIQEPCSEDEASVNVTVSWEPDGEVTSSFGCLPGLNR